MDSSGRHRSSCCGSLMEERTFTQSGRIHSGERICLLCLRIAETWNKEKKEWIEKEG